MWQNRNQSLQDDLSVKRRTEAVFISVIYRQFNLSTGSYRRKITNIVKILTHFTDRDKLIISSSNKNSAWNINIITVASSATLTRNSTCFCYSGCRLKWHTFYDFFVRLQPDRKEKKDEWCHRFEDCSITTSDRQIHNLNNIIRMDVCLQDLCH